MKNVCVLRDLIETVDCIYWYLVKSELNELVFFLKLKKKKSEESLKKNLFLRGNV